jgi:hypothetical protein
VDVGLKDGHYLGSATIKQKDFGIPPVPIAGGSVKVRDEMDFDMSVRGELVT